MTKLVNMFRKRLKVLYQPIEKLLGITDTTITKITKSKYTPNIIAKPLNSIQSYAHTVIEGRNDYQPSVRAVIKQYGDKHIKTIKIIRQPIQSFINTAFNALTFGQFQKKLDELPYDKLFHLRMVVTMEDGKQIQIEKNEVINISLKVDTIKGQEELDVPIHNSITLNQLLEGGKTILKDKYFSYRAFGNNCQDYQIALLKGSNLLNPQLEAFIKQDVSELANINPYLKKIANTMTDLGGKFNEIIHGTGIHTRHSKTHKVQSVVFDKKLFTIPEAKRWLKENNYLYNQVDKKLNTLRFRQLEPEDYKGWKYTTHRISKGIELIIIYKKNVIGNNIMKGKGDLIHIDLNSHNAKGKAKNIMKGEGLKKIVLGDTSDEEDEMEGGRLDIDVPNLNLNPTNTNPSFKKQGHKITSMNAFINNLSTDDIRDLKKLLSDVNEENLTKTEMTNKIRKATKSRVKRETTKKKPAKPKVRGTLEAKTYAINKHKKITL